MKITAKKPADLINDITLKKVILGGVALFVLNFLLGLATAKAQDPADSLDEVSQEITIQN